MNRASFHDDLSGATDIKPMGTTGWILMKFGLGKEKTMKKLVIVIMLVISTAFMGCAGMSDTEQRTLSGSAIGAAAGTAIGAIAGSAGWGAVIGATAGAAGGYLYDRIEKSKEAAYHRGYEEGKQSQ